MDETKPDVDYGGESMVTGQQEPQALAADAPETEDFHEKTAGRKWFKQWIPHDTVLNAGKCYLMKWVNACNRFCMAVKDSARHHDDADDVLKSLKDKYPEAEQETEAEYEVVYLCNFDGCGKVFTEQGALRKHAHVHGEKQFICHYEGCGKRFVDSSKLKRHFLIHTGEKHFICPFDGCGKAFSLDFNLRSHMRTHTQENYHICPFDDCRKRYAHEYKLRAHLRSHHDRTLPPDMKLTSPPQLEKEIFLPKLMPVASTSAMLDRPFACPYDGCDKRYIHEYKLNLHLRKEHAYDETLEEIARTGRPSDGEEELDDGSERELIAQSSKMGVVRGSGRGKLRIISKSASGKSTKRKRANAAPVDLNLKVQVGARPGRRKESARKGIQADSEETEEEDQDTEEDDIRRMLQMGMNYEDDEETEDDMD